MDEKLAEARARLLKLSEAAEADGEPLRWFEVFVFDYVMSLFFLPPL